MTKDSTNKIIYKYAKALVYDLMHKHSNGMNYSEQINELGHALKGVLTVEEVAQLDKHLERCLK